MAVEKEDAAGAAAAPAAQDPEAQDGANGATWLEPIEDSVLEVEPDSYFGEEAATLGDRIAAARQAAGLTQAGLAARLGVGAKIVSSWENDRSEPRSNRLAMLAGLLNVSVSWLLTGGGEGVAPPETPSTTQSEDAPRPIAVSVVAADLEASTRFYGDLLGGALIAAAAYAPADDEIDGPKRQDFAVFGHRISVADAADVAPPPIALTIDLDWEAWATFAARLRAAGAVFETEPEIRRLGAPGEHAILRVADPDDNLFAFVAMRHPNGGAVSPEGPIG